MSVKLYALSTCPYCRMTKKFLQEGGVEFELIEVDTMEGDTKDPSTPKGSAVEDVRRLSGGASFPVVVVGEEVIVGFNKKRIKELLGL